MIDPVRGMVEALLALEDMYNLEGVDDNGDCPSESEARIAISRAGRVLHSYRSVLQTEPFTKYVKEIQEEGN